MDTKGMGGHYIIHCAPYIAGSSNSNGLFSHVRLPARVTYHEGSETSGSSFPLSGLVSDGVECFLRKVEAHLHV